MMIVISDCKNVEGCFRDLGNLLSLQIKTETRKKSEKINKKENWKCALLINSALCICGMKVWRVTGMSFESFVAVIF